MEPALEHGWQGEVCVRLSRRRKKVILDRPFRTDENRAYSTRFGPFPRIQQIDPKQRRVGHKPEKHHCCFTFSHPMIYCCSTTSSRCSKAMDWMFPVGEWWSSAVCHYARWNHCLSLKCRVSSLNCLASCWRVTTMMRTRMTRDCRDCSWISMELRRWSAVIVEDENVRFWRENLEANADEWEFTVDEEIYLDRCCD